ncbi:MSMEG_0565 family glycosyltransferase [Labrys wisconsinensis]|uniref:Glycosyltransferase-like protein n=1 Tax=Labrys wisconsinensis TaxID=425677 RepID=A0ABU0J321_9HYPH|nr:MSMEG_0565 family glycosyltransferase [Labrys wisconsinensis]MDQ0467612.1 glycosyltransferase-like protein [Labrys wisconsinensis]
MTRPLRIAILAHSTNPRGGVVHALGLGDALARLGHDVVVHAPDPRGIGFFRPTLCATAGVPARPAGPDTADMVEIRAEDYVRYFEDPTRRGFDLYHAQDGISGNALATLRQRGLLARFARTVHHVDAFADARLAALQRRAILAADQLFVVSALWREHLSQRFGRDSIPVGNGVDRACFRPAPDGREDALRRRLSLGAGPVLLAVGGIEERKNTIRILQAFVEARRIHPSAQLVVAGGASLLDHGAYQARFAEALDASGLPASAVIVAGPIEQADMPALYRVADVLAFPSIREGFGLVVLEAMASGMPVVTAKIPPFTEHLGEDEVVWCDPHAPASIANAVLAALAEPLRSRLITRGFDVAARHDWQRTAAAHIEAYERLAEAAHA